MPFIINTDMNFMQPLPGPDTPDNQWKGSWVATRMFVHVDMATVNADTLPYQSGGCCLFCNINVRSAGIALADPNASESKHGREENVYDADPNDVSRTASLMGSGDIVPTRGGFIPA